MQGSLQPVHMIRHKKHVSLSVMVHVLGQEAPAIIISLLLSSFLQGAERGHSLLLNHCTFCVSAAAHCLMIPCMHLYGAVNFCAA